MNISVIKQELEDMATLSGIRACALVDSSSGLVVEYAGEGALEPTWEAAVDYWRIHFRLLPHFEKVDALGRIGAIAIHHTGGTLVIIPCPTQVDLVVICVGARVGVLWNEWQRRVRLLDSSLALRSA